MTEIPDTSPPAALDAAGAYLSASQNPDGGWGYAAGNASTVEATAAVSLALQGEPTLSAARLGALQWLRGAQHRDGGWGLQKDDDESGWQTAWSVLALAGGGGDANAVARGVDWLLSVKNLDVDEDAAQQADEVFGIDSALEGWPWLARQASWVEPTALALLALATAPATTVPKQRAEEAVTYLVDRRCSGGGWNVGNPSMFSLALPPRAHPTAWVLLALARVASERILPGDLQALQSAMESDAGAAAFSLGALAQRACAEDIAGTLSRLEQLQQPDGSWDGNPFHTALAVLALAGGASL